MFDVVIENLREQQQRFIRGDRKSETGRKFCRQHSLRKRDQPRGHCAWQIEESLMAIGIEVDIDVAHQLRQLRRLSILHDHLGADSGDP
jgi:hypothetical protein